MKHCSLCKTDLPTPLSEYGNHLLPLCQGCWLSWGVYCGCDDGRVICGNCVGVGCHECDYDGWFICAYCVDGVLSIDQLMRMDVDELLATILDPNDIQVVTQNPKRKPENDAVQPKL